MHHVRYFSKDLWSCDIQLSLSIGALYGSIAAAFMTPAPHPKPNIIQALGLVSRYTLLIGKSSVVCIPVLSCSSSLLYYLRQLA